MFGKRGENIGSIDDAPSIQAEPVSVDAAPAVEQAATPPAAPPTTAVAVSPPPPAQHPAQQSTSSAPAEKK